MAGNPGMTKRKTQRAGVNGKGRSVQISAGDLRSWVAVTVYPEMLSQLHRCPITLETCHAWVPHHVS